MSKEFFVVVFLWKSRKIIEIIPFINTKLDTLFSLWEDLSPGPPSLLPGPVGRSGLAAFVRDLLGRFKICY